MSFGASCWTKVKAENYDHICGKLSDPFINIRYILHWGQLRAAASTTHLVSKLQSFSCFFSLGLLRGQTPVQNAPFKIYIVPQWTIASTFECVVQTMCAIYHTHIRPIYTFCQRPLLAFCNIYFHHFFRFSMCNNSIVVRRTLVR